MNAEFYGGITVDLNDGPVRTHYFRGADGKTLAQLVIGEPNRSVAISVTTATPEAVDQLQEAVAQLAAWVSRTEQLKKLPEVA